MKKLLLITLFIAQLFGYQNIIATKQNIEKLKCPIIDIRLPEEWKATGTIPNAKKITFFMSNGSINPSFTQELQHNNITKNSKFAVICRTGHRSRVASAILEKNGYKNIINLKGGMFNLFKSLLKELKHGK
jgi:rhodanese-related sulfurtransferase